MLAISPTLAAADATAAKRADVEMKGSQVMPFSQSDTMHMFRPTAAGGVQTVMVKDGDARQIAFVRSHLRKEAFTFARGDYRDPAAIHGMDMPGLATFACWSGAPARTVRRRAERCRDHVREP